MSLTAQCSNWRCSRNATCQRRTNPFAAPMPWCEVHAPSARVPAKRSRDDRYLDLDPVGWDKARKTWANPDLYGKSAATDDEDDV